MCVCTNRSDGAPNLIGFQVKGAVFLLCQQKWWNCLFFCLLPWKQLTGIWWNFDLILKLLNTLCCLWWIESGFGIWNEESSVWLFLGYVVCFWGLIFFVLHLIGWWILLELWMNSIEACLVDELIFLFFSEAIGEIASALVLVLNVLKCVRYN